MNYIDNQKFNKNGYFVIKNLLNKDEIAKYLKSIEKKRESLIKQNAASASEEKFKINSSDTSNFKNYSEYDDRDLWEYVSNKKLVDTISKLIGEKAYFVHDLGLLDPGSNPNNDCSWHRDSPCRSTGVGPDWDQKFKYNVVTAITYLRSSEECGTGLNLIPGSHKLSYKKTISNIVRFTHLKTRNNNLLKNYRNLTSRLIGKTIKYNAGDCIVFLCTLYHTPVLIHNNKPKHYRQCITSRYGGYGKHSNTYIDYVVNKRPEMNKYTNSKEKDNFINYIKDKNLFLPFVEDSKKIEGAFIKKN